MTERKALGRGLASLIPTPKPFVDLSTASTASSIKGDGPATGILEVSISQIRANPHQPRRRMSESALEELAQSIRKTGVLQPILVRKTDSGYELIAGERRLRASKLAGREKVPVIVRATTNQDQLELALIENLQREDLTPIEEAHGYDQLIREFSLTQEDVARRVGKERSTITNLLRLLKLSPVVQEMINAASLSMGHARALIPLEDHRRQEVLAQRIEKQGLSVRQVEELVRSMLHSASKKISRLTDKVSTNANLRYLADDIQRCLGTRVEIVSKGKGGEVRIQYYSADDLKRLSERLLK